MARTLTAADAVIVLNVTDLSLGPVQLQGFAADDVFDIENIKSVEAVMGVDGKLSGGFIFAEVTQGITLQADSLSNDFFDALWTQSQANRTVYYLSGVTSLPAVGTKYTHTRGLLIGWKPAPDAKKILQPRKFAIVWEKIAPSPL